LWPSSCSQRLFRWLFLHFSSSFHSSFFTAHMRWTMADFGSGVLLRRRSAVYPDKLNPFGSTLSCDEPRNSYDETKNPFSVDEEEEEKKDQFSGNIPFPPKYAPTPAPRKKLLNLTRPSSQLPAYNSTAGSAVYCSLSRSASERKPAPTKPVRNGQGDDVRSEDASETEISKFPNHQSKRPAPLPPSRENSTQKRVTVPRISTQTSIMRSPSAPAGPRRSPPEAKNGLRMPPMPMPMLKPVSALQTSFRTPIAKEKERRAAKSLVRADFFSAAFAGNFRDFLVL
jgi:hypothetical protein